MDKAEEINPPLSPSLRKVSISIGYKNKGSLRATTKEYQTTMEEKEQMIQEFSESVAKIKAELHKDIIGQEEVIDDVVIAIIAGGNVLLEGVPGTGKTRLVRSLGQTLDLPFSRIQFTPDLMPNDVTGTNIIRKDDDGNLTTHFQKGPIFAQIILADEINRATPKTQSALLEVMQEHKTTVAGKTTSRSSDGPFHVQGRHGLPNRPGTR